MSLPVFQATIVNDSGDIIPSAVVTVLDEITGLGLTIYSDRAGTVPLGTNGVFTAGTDGFAQFFAPAGNYRVKAEQAASGFEKTWDFVPLVGGAAFVDTGTGAGQVPTNADLPTFGTAATANVQTSPTDNTAGRLMVVGAFGLGVTAKLKPTLNLDTYPSTGSYAYDDNSGSVPSVENGIVLCEFRDSTTAGLRRTQRAVTRSNSQYTRNDIGGTWTAWQPVWTGANYQPDDRAGLNTKDVYFMVSGTAAVDGTVSGSLLYFAKLNSAGQYVPSTNSPTGTFKNLGVQSCSTTTPCTFTRQA